MSSFTTGGLTEVPTDELLLSFQDFPTTHVPSSANSSSSTTRNAEIRVDLQQQTNSPKKNQQFNNENSNTVTGLDVDNDDDGENAQNSGSNKSFWTLEYYQQFFDVETKDVIERIMASLIPNMKINSLKQKKPDLYGPFWISVTLIFTIAISGNIASYLQHASSHYKWRYDFHLVSYAATTIFLYISIVPLSLWALLKWSKDSSNADLEGLDMEINVLPKALELICIYGYSLFVYIPASILWTIQVNWLQWLLVIVAACISGSVLILTLLPSFKLSKHKLLLIIGAVSCHVLLAAGFMLYFFHVPDSSTNLNPTNPSSPPPIPAVSVNIETNH